MYEVAINELYFVQISGLWVYMGTNKHTLPATSMLNALVNVAELIHKQVQLHATTHTLLER